MTTMTRPRTTSSNRPKRYGLSRTSFRVTLHDRRAVDRFIERFLQRRVNYYDMKVQITERNPLKNEYVLTVSGAHMGHNEGSRRNNMTKLIERCCEGFRYQIEKYGEATWIQVECPKGPDHC